jgi:hypothetical protein
MLIFGADMLTKNSALSKGLVVVREMRAEVVNGSAMRDFTINGAEIINA